MLPQSASSGKPPAPTRGGRRRAWAAGAFFLDLRGWRGYPFKPFRREWRRHRPQGRIHTEKAMIVTTKQLFAHAYGKYAIGA